MNERRIEVLDTIAETHAYAFKHYKGVEYCEAMIRATKELKKKYNK